MTTKIGLTSESSSPQINGPIYSSAKEVRTKFTEVALKVLRELAKDFNDRIHGYPNDTELLKKGVFYPNDYYLALKATNQTALLGVLKKQGNFFHGYAPTQFFSIKKNDALPTGFIPCAYQLKPGKLPSEALKALRTGLTLLGCGEALRLAQYEALLALLGEEKFNAILSSDSQTPLGISCKDLGSSDPMRALIKDETQSKVRRPGQHWHFANVPLYSIKHYNGEAIGYNVFSCDEGSTFIGLGLDPAGVTKGQIAQQLLDALNKPPINREIVTEQVASKIMASFEDDFEQLTERFANFQAPRELFDNAKGGQVTQVVDVREDRLFALTQASTEKAAKLMKQWVLEGSLQT